MKRMEVDVLGEQTNAPVIKLPQRRFPGVVLQGDSLHVLHTLAAKVSAALAKGRAHEAGEGAAELREVLDGYVGAYEDALVRAGVDLPYTKKQSADPPRGEGAEPGSGWERAAARPAEAPAGPWHDFFLLQEGLEPYAEDIKWYGRRGTVRLSDDIISYLYDSLEWIPSLNPSNPEEWQGHGLNRWGSTVINREGAPTALRVFSAWAELFAAGPAQLVLCSGCVEGPDDEKGYQKLLVPRDELVEKMRTLADYARRSVDGEAYILHIGV